MAEGDREVLHFKLLETNTNIYKYANEIIKVVMSIHLDLR